MGTYKGFDSVELRRPTRSTFNLSHEKRVSGRIGKLHPILITETMPNDSFRGSTEVLVKLAPMIAPIYHRLNLYVHYFFVPNRLLWKDWETFITGGRLGEAVTSPPVPPQVNIGSVLLAGGDYFDVGTLADYLGVPIIPDADYSAWNAASSTMDIMPFGAYYKCWYDYYRDRNYNDDTSLLPFASGFFGLDTDLLQLRDRCWEHDYFTSAQLTTQRGAEVLIPLQGTGTGTVNYLDISQVKKSDGTAAAASKFLGTNTIGAPQLAVGKLVAADNTEVGRIENIDDIDVDITNSDVSVNDLRRALRLQEWLERNELAGSRYNESIYAHFGTKTSDGRLQRAEYLGGGKAVIQISEVMTTAYSEDGASQIVPPGNPAGRGSTYSDINRFSYTCEEHGFIVGILSVMPTSAYMQGMPRMFQNRNTFLEYPWPTFAHLGEQEVFDSEIFVNPTSVPEDRATQPVFGYQSRYADWKYIPSSSHGDFRTSLDFWHLTRKFSGQPVLDGDFVLYDEGLSNRIFNVSDVDNLWMYIYNKLTVKRSLPYFGTPQT
ncbi:major capsid protein [Blackfly microvirus SF02]|uniref:Major capsid protein n=1 Tax=Blackfly microvirus SF02 TaxID=2576452 RepID=A0A4P8PKM5_9VIRU|nr:major capsid protein [Blackfly microvirus SF02]